MIWRAAPAACLALSAGLAIGLMSPVAALELEIPVDCTIGGDCYIQSYADRDPGPGATDFSCNPLSYDTHSGTDFRVPTFSAMRAGVNILAAADGTVRGVRDGEPDSGVDGMTQDRDCGNGVLIEHGDGWATQYCHLAKGSVQVRVGDAVRAGDRIGRMGFSGRTEFPHLHLTVRKDGKPVDPFDARANSESCTLADEAPLWSPAARAQLVYQPGGAVDAGFAAEAPTLANVRLGEQFAAPDRASPILAYWARFYGVRKGDVIHIRLLRPDSGEFAQTHVEIPRDRAEYFHYIGGRKPAKGWPAGIYQGEATLLRAGQPIDRIEAQVTVE